MLDNNLRNDFVAALMRIPVLSDFNARSSLLYGLPTVALTRSTTIPQLDLLTIINELDILGRLDDTGGARPLVVVAQNALKFVPAGSEVGKELQDVMRRLEEYYGGEYQPALVSQPTPGEEAVLGGTDERVGYAFMHYGLETSRSVARLSVPRIFDGKPPQGVIYGTGWLVAPGLLLTNHHVINARIKELPNNEQDASDPDFQAQAEGTVARFDYFVEGEGGSYIECAGATLVAKSSSPRLCLDPAERHQQYPKPHAPADRQETAQSGARRSNEYRPIPKRRCAEVCYPA